MQEATLTANFGRFSVRLFGDNNRTPCFRCGQTSHPSYQCPNKNETIRKCHRCGSSDHLIRDCTVTSRQCHFCKETGHIQRDCLQRTRFEQYGEYAAEIEEDNNISTCSEVVCTDDENKNINNEEIPQTNLEDGQKAPCVPTVILGASNANRMDIVNDNVCNASINGASFGEIDRLIDKAKNMTNEQIENVILHLGTNDIMTTKNDTDQVMIRVIDALGKVGKAFPDHTKIGVCTILKRKAKGTRPQAFNEAVLKEDTANCGNCSESDICIETKEGRHICLEQDVCPYDGVPFNHKCYFFSSGWMRQDENLAFCAGIGAKMVRIDNDNVTSFLKSEMATRDLSFIWISANDRDVEGEWMWGPGDKVMNPNWGYGEPNNYNGIQDCAVMKQDGTWEDKNCENGRHYGVCEDL